MRRAKFLGNKSIARRAILGSGNAVTRRATFRANRRRETSVVRRIGRGEAQGEAVQVLHNCARGRHCAGNFAWGG